MLTKTDINQFRRPAVILKACVIALLTVLFCLMLRWWNGIVMVKSAAGVKQSSYMYAQPRDTIDLVMMGSSRVHCNVNTAVLWDTYGLAAYDYSAAEQPLWITYYYLQEICKTQSPKAVVLDLYCPARFKDDYQETWLGDNLYGVRFSLNKLKMLAVSCHPKDWLSYMPAFSANHYRYRELTDEDWTAGRITDYEKQEFKGFTAFYNVNPMERPSLPDVGAWGLTEKSERYLYKIIDYCRKKDIQLMFVVAPYVVEPDDQATYNAIAVIAEQEGIPLCNANEYYDEMGLDFGTDYTDHSHLNYTGSHKYTLFLAQKIHEAMELPDRRGDPAWESWDRNRDAIYEEVMALSDFT